MEDIVKSLKELSLEILQAEKRNTNEWLKAVSNLHEQLLILKYLDDRKQQLESIEKKVKEKLENIVTDEPLEVDIAAEPIVTKPKETPIAKEPTPEPILGEEIRRVPDPQGPPVNHEADSIYEEPKPVTPVVEVEKMEDKPETVIEEAPKPEPVAKVEPTPVKEETPIKVSSGAKVSIAEKAAASKAKKSLNEKLSGNSIKFGLNDRIAFVKHLFNGSQEDFNRVLSQLNSFNDYSEAQNFIEHIVKPEYNWGGKPEFEERFMESLENRYA